jgi:hypothetical protein
MKKIVVLCFMIFAQFVFSQTCPDYFDNGQFLRQEECYKYYRKKNEGIIEDVKVQLAKEVNSRLKKQTTASQVYDSCTSKISTVSGTSSNFPQRLIVSWLSQNNWGNFDFRSVDTSLFYTQKDSFECSVKVNLIKLNYPDRLRDNNEPYWENDALIARWKITADSFKSCGVKIESLNITTLERVGSRANDPPILNMNTGMVTSLLEPFEENDKDAHELTLKYIYADDWKNDKATAVRGDVDYTFANTFKGYDPTKTFVAFKKDILYSPIRPAGLPKSHLNYADEAHEGFHAATGINAADGHIVSAENKDVYNVMVDSLMRNSGSFTKKQCKELRERGAQRGFLRCQ